MRADNLARPTRCSAGRGKWSEPFVSISLAQRLPSCVQLPEIPPTRVRVTSIHALGHHCDDQRHSLSSKSSNLIGLNWLGNIDLIQHQVHDDACDADIEPNGPSPSHNFSMSGTIILKSIINRGYSQERDADCQQHMGQ